MKVVILAGGRGSRLSEETVHRPKPLVEIESKPILWHIMKLYSLQGFNEFIICCGYKGHMIKDYFLNYHMRQSNVTFMLKDGKTLWNESSDENWQVTLADTGLNTLTAGRILRVRDYIGDDEDFMVAYGDNVADVDILAMLDFHKSHGKAATISVTRPTGRFGGVSMSEDGQVLSFKEKDREDQPWVNIGFMAFNRKAFDYLGDGDSMLEDEPFKRLAADGQMMAYRHNGFWSPMDTIRDREYLEGLYSAGDAPWLVGR